MEWTNMGRTLAGGLGIAGLVAALSLVSWGSGRTPCVPVSGRVLIDGQPLAAGFVCVFPVGQRMATGTIEKDGRFQLSMYTSDDGCPRGRHRVAIIATEVIDDEHLRWLAPKPLADPSTSQLWVEITGPTGDCNLQLSWHGGQPFTERMGNGPEFGPRRPQPETTLEFAAQD